MAKEKKAKKEEKPKVKKAVKKTDKKKDIKVEKAAKKNTVKKIKAQEEKKKVIKEVKKKQISMDLGEGRPKLYEVLEYPLITEKAVNMIEAENKLVFVVNKNAEKSDVKKAVEALYQVKVDKVNIIRDMSARKKALVKINKAFKAEEIATKLGVL